MQTQEDFTLTAADNSHSVLAVALCSIRRANFLLPKKIDEVPQCFIFLA
jgi:hypothetical protein